MDWIEYHLDDVRKQLAPSDELLQEAKRRRALVLQGARGFPGDLRTFASGSLAHGTANCPIHKRDAGLDADCGIVLDRRSHILLGPDGDGVGSRNVVDDMADHLTAFLSQEAPSARLKVSKRAITVEFHSPLDTGEDPTVDLIVALTRKDKTGLWIPNTIEDNWDASDPERHTELFTSGEPGLKRTRARAVRLAKAANKRIGNPPFCSFNIETFGYMFIKQEMPLANALENLWSGGAADLQARLTPDPAGISAPIKVTNRQEAVNELRFAANVIKMARLNPNDEATVRSNLACLWPDFISRDGGESKARLAAAINNRKPITLNPKTGGIGISASGLLLKQPRAFGS